MPSQSQNSVRVHATRLTHTGFKQHGEPRGIIKDSTFSPFQNFNSIKLTPDESLFCMIHKNKAFTVTSPPILTATDIQNQSDRGLATLFSTVFPDAGAGVSRAASSLSLGHFNPASWHGRTFAILLPLYFPRWVFCYDRIIFLRP